MATVLVLHRSATDRKGHTYMTGGRPVVHHLRCMYIGGTCSTQVGDVWNIKPYAGPEADFVTTLEKQDA